MCVAEFTVVTEDDIDFLKKHIQADVVIFIEQEQMLKGFDTTGGVVIAHYGKSSEYVSYGDDSRAAIELISYIEGERGSEVIGRIDTEKTSLHLNTFGVHYGYPYLLAYYIHHHVLEAQKKA
jgi:hypothetical protein